MNGTSVANRWNHQVLRIEKAWSASSMTPAILANFINLAIGKSIKSGLPFKTRDLRGGEMATWKRDRNLTTTHANMASQPANYIYRYPATIALLWSKWTTARGITLNRRIQEKVWRTNFICNRLKVFCRRLILVHYKSLFFCKLSGWKQTNIVLEHRIY